MKALSVAILAVLFVFSVGAIDVHTPEWRKGFWAGLIVGAIAIVLSAVLLWR